MTSQPGDLIESLATDPGSVPDFNAWCTATGNELVEQSEDGRRLPLRDQEEVSRDDDRWKPTARRRPRPAQLREHVPHEQARDHRLERATSTRSGRRSSSRTTGAAMGMETTIFFTFWGLFPLVRNEVRITGENWMQKMMSMMNRGGTEHLKLGEDELRRRRARR